MSLSVTEHSDLHGPGSGHSISLYLAHEDPRQSGARKPKVPVVRPKLYAGRRRAICQDVHKTSTWACSIVGSVAGH